MSSSAVVYVDESLVAYEAKKLFHEAAGNCGYGHSATFFDNKGSLGCLTRVVTRKVEESSKVKLRRTDIRRKVKEFLQFLKDRGILKKEESGHYHGMWVFDWPLLAPIEVVSSTDVPTTVSVSASPRLPRAKKRQSKPRREYRAEARDELSFVNDPRRRPRHA